MVAKYNRLKFDKWISEKLEPTDFRVPQRDLILDRFEWTCPVCSTKYGFTLQKNGYMNSFVPTCDCGHVGTRLYHKHNFEN